MEGIDALRSDRNKILAVLLGVFVALLLAELLLTLFNIPAAGSVKHRFSEPPMILPVQGMEGLTIHRLAPWSRMEYLYPPSRGRSGWTVTVTANADGFRGSCRVPSDSFPGLRVFFLGDSFTFGDGVELKDIYPEQTVRLLRKDGVEAVGISRAMFGYDMIQNQIVFDEFAGTFDPDVVVLGYFLNDTSGPLFVFDPATGLVSEDHSNPFLERSRTPDAPLIRHLRLPRLLWNGFHVRARARRTRIYYRELYKADNPWCDWNMEALHRLIRYCDEGGIRLIILVFPVLDELEASYPFEDIHAFVARKVRSWSGPHTQLIDLLPILKGRASKTMWVHPLDHHPNAMVHEEVARILAQAIRSTVPRPLVSPSAD